METKTVMTDAQEWLREYIESDAWRDERKGVWTARQFIQVLPDDSCGDGDWCAFHGEGRGPKAQYVNWDSWAKSVEQDGETLNPRLEYPTAPPPAPPQPDKA